MKSSTFHISDLRIFPYYFADFPDRDLEHLVETLLKHARELSKGENLNNI